MHLNIKLKRAILELSITLVLEHYYGMYDYRNIYVYYVSQAYRNSVYLFR